MTPPRRSDDEPGSDANARLLLDELKVTLLTRNYLRCHAPLTNLLRTVPTSLTPYGRLHGPRGGATRRQHACQACLGMRPRRRGRSVAAAV
eukprot:scaffold89261_cov61-Phaeocystis_antarctica.AAC.1